MTAPRLTLGRSKRLTHAREFEAVHAARLRRVRGPIALAAVPSGLPHPRLGLAIAKSAGKKGAKAGTAVFRNRLKRLLREAFRLEQHALPRGYDFVVSARPHEILPLAEYRRLLVELAQDVEVEASRRARRSGDAAGGER